MQRITIVIPCYNEAKRLHREVVREYLSRSHDVGLLFVNDGSTDTTVEVLQHVTAGFSDRASVLDLPQNRGKAEAVRAGLMHTLQASNAEYVGFWDADLATPLETILSFASVLSTRPQVNMVFGARVKLLGRTVERRPLRHYLGRVFATAASACLKLPIYDTQCGAKLFRRTPELLISLKDPFRSRWIFDVELIARLIALRGPRAMATEIHEYPLETWRDVAGSKVRPKDFVRALYELLQIRLHDCNRRSASTRLQIGIAAPDVN